MDTAEWTAPDEQGNQRCPRHPGVAPFHKDSAGCSACDSDPPPARVDEPGPGQLECAAAERRGLPDALEVEARMWNVWAFATRRAEAAARKADELTDGDEPDFDLGAKYEAAAAKWMDVSVKAGKIATAPVLVRERTASQERAARDVSRAKGAN